MLGKIEGKRKRGQQRMKCFDRLSGHESEQTLGDSEGQGSLVWGSPLGHKELDVTWRLNNNLYRHFFKENTQIANKFMQRSSTSVIIKENQNTGRYHLTLIRMATIKSKQTHSVGRMCRHWKHCYEKWYGGFSKC